MFLEGQIPSQKVVGSLGKCIFHKKRPLRLRQVSAEERSLGDGGRRFGGDLSCFYYYYFFVRFFYGFVFLGPMFDSCLFPFFLFFLKGFLLLGCCLCRCLIFLSVFFLLSVGWGYLRLFDLFGFCFSALALSGNHRSAAALGAPLIFPETKKP